MAAVTVEQYFNVWLEVWSVSEECLDSWNPHRLAKSYTPTSSITTIGGGAEIFNCRL
jgi:hypothetical protein